MGFFGGGKRKRGGSSEWKTVDDTLELFKQIFGTNTSETGETITWKTALQVSTVLAITRVIANGLAQVPLKLFAEPHTPATDHPLYWLLYRKPNPWHTSFEYRHLIGAHLTLCGNHYSFINRVGDKIVELIPLEPGSVTVDRKGLGDPIYRYQPIEGGPSEPIPRKNMWHIRALSWNGWIGLEPVRLAREAIGLAITTERQQSKLFKNGTNISGTYSVDRKLDKGQYESLRDWIVKNTTGDNGGMPLILDSGAKWLQTAMTGVDAQQLETRNHQVEEVCRAMGVFPQMVGHSDKTSTFASAESFFIAHVVHTLAPLYELIEQSIACSLLSDADMKAGIYAKFIEEGLMRGSMVDTAAMLDKYVNSGLMTPNEARSKLDMNPDPDPASDKLRVPANIVGKEPAAGAEPAPDPAAQAKSMLLEQAEASDERMRAWVDEIKLALAQAPTTINIGQPAVTVNTPDVHVSIAKTEVNVEQPAITVNTPDVHVTTPDIKVDAPAITVNTPDIHVTVPERSVVVNTPDVKIDAPVTVHTPETQVTVNTPDIKVETPITVNTPEVKPEIRIDAPVTVNVEKGVGKVDFTQDDDGNITGAVMN